MDRSKEIIEQLVIMQQELKALEKLQESSIDKNKLDVIQSDISTLRVKIKKLGKICLDSEECRIKLRTLNLDVNLLLSPDGETTQLQNIVIPGSYEQIDPVGKLRQSNNNLDMLTQSSQVDPVLAEWKLSSRQSEANQEKIMQLQAALDNTRAASEQSQYETQTQLKNTISDLQATEAAKNQAIQTEMRLESQLANTEAQSLSVSGHYAAYTAQLQQELDNVKLVNDTLQSREIRLNESLKQFEKSDQLLQSQVRDLRDSYEEKLRDLQEDYAQKVSQGGQILSEREQELMHDINRLKSALESANTALERSNDTNRTALIDLQSSERPCGELAVELISLKERMSFTNRQMLTLQEERDNLISRKAEFEVQYQRRLAEGQAANTNQIQRLNKELQAKNQDIMQKQQEVTEMHNDLTNLKAESENKISQLNMQLMQTIFELKQFQESQSQQTRMMQEKERMLNDRSRSQTLDNEFKLRQSEAELKRRYDDIAKDLENKMRYGAQAREEQTRQLQSVRAQQEAKAQDLQRRQAQLDQSESIYTSKMAQYQRQTDQLNSAISQAETRANQLANLEKDYRNRIDQIRSTALIDREQANAEIKSLKQQLSNALQAKSSLQANLTNCNSTRDGMILQMNQLTQDNNQLKNKFLSLQAQFEQNQIQHGILVEKLRTENSKMASNLALASSTIEQIPEIHSHNLLLEQKMKQIRDESQIKEKELNSSRENLTKVLAESSFASQRVQQLQEALMSCDTSKKMLQTTVESSSEQIRELQRLRLELENSIQTNAEDFEYILKDRSHEFQRHQQQLKNKETNMMYQIQELESKNSRKENKIQQLQNQTHQIADSLSDQVLFDAQSLKSLSNAIPGNYSQRPTGRSNLIKK
jgi:chromosome segregation ATPase